MKQRRCVLNVPERSLFELIPQIAWRMALVWKKISHPGIVVFRGVNTENFPLELVYDWGVNIVQRVELHLEASRQTLVLCSLPCDTTGITSPLVHSY
jgi:hypothetical protein